MGRKIHIPGMGEVELAEAPPDQAQNQILVQLLNRIAGLIDISLQVQLRLALGWKPEDVIADMKLNVPPVPATSLSRQQRRAVLRQLPKLPDGDGQGAG